MGKRSRRPQTDPQRVLTRKVLVGRNVTRRLYNGHARAPRIRRSVALVGDKLDVPAQQPARG